MLKVSQLQGFNAAKPNSGGGWWSATAYTLVTTDNGDGTGCLYDSTHGSVSPSTFRGVAILAVSSSGEMTGAANIMVSGEVDADFIDAVTVNGVTLNTSSAEYTADGNTTWEWTGANFVGNAPGTYVMEIR